MGMAVDISICKASWNDASWREGAAKCHIDTIPMGVKVDHMGVESHIDKEQELVSRGMISREALNNRRLLREVMRLQASCPCVLNGGISTFVRGNGQRKT